MSASSAGGSPITGSARHRFLFFILAWPVLFERCAGLSLLANRYSRLEGVQGQRPCGYGPGRAASRFACMDARTRHGSPGRMKPGDQRTQQQPPENRSLRGRTFPQCQPLTGVWGRGSRFEGKPAAMRATQAQAGALGARPALRCAVLVIPHICLRHRLHHLCFLSL